MCELNVLYTCRWGGQITFHQLFLNGNFTAITANLLLGSRNEVI